MERAQNTPGEIKKARRPVAFALILALLILRIPFLTGVLLFTGAKPAWVALVFENGTFLLTAALIWWERKRLEEYHMGYGAVGIFIAGPFIFAGMLALNNHAFPIPWSQMLISLLLLIGLIIKRPALPRVTRKSAVWILISIPVGFAVGALSGYMGSVIMPGPKSTSISFPLFLLMFARQLTWAATLEEPLFRGFLWGLLKNYGWKDIWICFFQSGLFLLAHSYYITANILIFLRVFIAAFILGVVAWKSRSIANSMVVHGLTNSVADIVAHFNI